MTRPVDAVLFDFGGVFIDSPFAVMKQGAARLGMPVELLSSVMFGSYDRDDDHPWHRLERGEVGLEDARSEIVGLAREAGLHGVDPFDVLSSLSGSSHGPRGFVVELVADLRHAGLKTGIVTNNVAEFAPMWRPILPLDELFDDVVDSSEVGVRKPNPAIFELACRRLDIEPSRALFIDDFEGNVVGARSAGLAGICCGYTLDTTSEAVEEIRRLVRLR